jgi:hypothetical protein
MSNEPEPRVRYGGSFELVSVRQGLIELEFGDRLRIRGIESGGLIEREFGLGWSAGGSQERRPARKIEVGEDRANGNGVRNEGDDAHRSTAGRAHEREHLINPGDEGRPARGSTAAWGVSAGRAHVGLRVELAWRRLLHATLLTPELDDLIPKLCVGRQHAVIAVAMDAWWVNEQGEPLEELQRSEGESDGTIRCGTGETIDDALTRCGTVAGSFEPFEGEGRTGNAPLVRTVAQESFEPSTVTGRDVDRGIDAEPAGGLPSEHVVGDVAFEQAVAVEVTEHAVANGVLELAPVGSREMGGLVELDRAQGILAEHTVDDTDMEMEVSVQR